MFRSVKNALSRLADRAGVLSAYHILLALAGHWLYGRPSRRLVVVGVTGTKGKSTVLELINAGLEAAGKKTVLASSIRFKVGDKAEANNRGNTMPGRGFLQKLMKRGVTAGCQYALLEVVSEGIVQHRHRFIEFDAAVLVNIHPEHIESHGSFENYREAKLKFFRDTRKHSHKKPKRFFVNEDDPSANYFIEAAGGEEVILTTETKKPVALEGDFNRENAGAAEAVLRSLGIEDEVIETAFRKFKGVPGRMDFIQKEPFAVVVDYAHTPDSLEAVYRNLERTAGGGLICVLGSAGGGRDRWKRPKLGEIAGRYCGDIILTDEDPFDEDPAQILEDIKEGISGIGEDRIVSILDRKQAIEAAVAKARPGDTVIITGKGSEPYIRVARGRRIPWSDVGVVKEILGQ